MLKTSERTGGLLVAGSTLAIGTGFIVAMSAIEPPKGITEYKERLVGASSGNDCLNDTPYDYKRGALVRPNRDNEHAITIKPAENAAQLPTISLVAYEQTYDGLTTYFIPTDGISGQTLADNQCAVQPGY